MNESINPHLLLHAVIMAAGGKICLTEHDVMEAQMAIMDGAMLHVVHLPGVQVYELAVRDPNAPIQETATIIEPRALPAPRKG